MLTKFQTALAFVKNRSEGAWYFNAALNSTNFSQTTLAFVKNSSR